MRNEWLAMSTIDTMPPGLTAAVKSPVRVEKVMLPVTAAQTGPQVDVVKEAPAVRASRRRPAARGSPGSCPRSRSRRSTGSCRSAPPYCPSNPRARQRRRRPPRGRRARPLRPRPKAEAVPLSPTFPSRHTAAYHSTQPLAADSPEMSYLPAGSAVTDVHGGRVAGSGRRRRPRFPAGALLRPALALTTVGAASLIAAALALPAEEAQRTEHPLPRDRPDHARTSDRPQRQPAAGHGRLDRRGLGPVPLGRIAPGGATRSPVAGMHLRDADHRQLRRHRLPAGRDDPIDQGCVEFDRAADELAVVGGTGAYLGIRGSFTSQPLGKRTSTRSSDLVRLLR